VLSAGSLTESRSVGNGGEATQRLGNVIRGWSDLPLHAELLESALSLVTATRHDFVCPLDLRSKFRTVASNGLNLEKVNRLHERKYRYHLALI